MARDPASLEPEGGLRTEAELAAAAAAVDAVTVDSIAVTVDGEVVTSSE